MSSFTPKHYHDMFIYYNELEMFFKVTGLSSDRSSLTRAQKARGKLLKLSDPQFYELSTDVYDELQRRINEDQDQCNYLLPKASFHFKRNQARQKLSSLAQLRFGDLVDDILFEIKRRGFDIDINSNDDRSLAKKDEELLESEEKTVSLLSESANKPFPESPMPPTSSVQTSQIIPQKASMAWSSEEEEEEEEEEEVTEGREGDQNESPVHNTKEPIELDDLNSVQKSINLNEFPETPVLSTENSDFLDNSDDISSNPISNPQQLHSFGNSPAHSTFSPIDKYYAFGGANQPQDIFKINTDFRQNASIENSLDQADADLVVDDRVNNEEVAIPSNEELIKKIAPTEIDDQPVLKNEDLLKRELSNFSSQVSSLSIENEKLKQKISELELNSKNIIGKQNKMIIIESNIADRFQYQYLLDESFFDNYTDPKGQIPITKIVKLNPLINSFFQILLESTENVGDLLFETLLNISSSINEVIGILDNTEFREEITLLKATLSQLISSVRYYAVYGNLLPKITVQAAVSELAFSICRLVTAAKIEQNEGNENSINMSSFNIDYDYASSTLLDGNIKPENSFLSNQADMSGYMKRNQEDMSPVKPLKITQKVNRNNDSKSSSFRKSSNTSLFHSMLGTRSPNLSCSSLISEEINELQEDLEIVTSSPIKSGVGLGIRTYSIADGIIESNDNTGDIESIKEIYLKTVTEGPHSGVGFTPIQKTNDNIDFITQGSREVKSDEDTDKNLQLFHETETENITLVKKSRLNDIVKIDNIIESDTEENTNPESLPTISTEVNAVESADEQLDCEKNEESSNETNITEGFDIEGFDIENTANTLQELLLYVEHQTFDVISTIQSLLVSIKEPNVTKGNLRSEANAINQVIEQMSNATSTSMNQSRNASLKEHGSWVVQSLQDCRRRITTLCEITNNGLLEENQTDSDFADKQFKQRLAGIAFDIAKCTKELVKSIEEACLKEKITQLSSE